MLKGGAYTWWITVLEGPRSGPIGSVMTILLRPRSGLTCTVIAVLMRPLRGLIMLQLKCKKGTR